MRTNSLYISSIKPHSGSLIVSIGMMEILKARFEKVAFYRPFIEREHDGDISFMLKHYDLKMSYEQAYSFHVDEVEALISKKGIKKVLSKILDDFNALQEEYDFVLCEGLNRQSFHTSILEDLNMEVSTNIGAPFVSVLNAKGKSLEEVQEELAIESEVLDKYGCIHFASFINRVDTKYVGKIKETYHECELSYVIAEIEELDFTTVAEVLNKLSCIQVFGSALSLHRSIRQSKIAAMTLENYLARMKEGDFVIVPADRVDILVGILAAYHSKSHPNIAGIMLTGDLLLSPEVMNLFHGSEENFPVPILHSKEDTFSVASQMQKVHAKIYPESDKKISLAIGAFNSSVDASRLAQRFLEYKSNVVTPLMFEYSLFEMARAHKKKIVLPEALDERILRASEILLGRDIVEIILLGNADEITFKAKSLNIDISKAQLLDVQTSPLQEEFSQHFYTTRKDKGLSLMAARDAMIHTNYFATMMVELGHADGMVSGAIHTTQDTIRPALQIIKSDVSLVSSAFFMCMDTEVLVYADCAINQDPSAEELAQIAISSAQTATQFGIDTRIAMLSYSTGNSGKGEDVEKVKEATLILKERAPELLVEGPIQYDAAIDEKVARTKLPDSKVAGHANIFIFPDLNTGNNTYKAVQRASNAVAIGPVLQGLRKPVNDLSRGCSVTDIINTIAITAIQAQERT